MPSNQQRIQPQTPTLCKATALLAQRGETLFAQGRLDELRQLLNQLSTQEIIANPTFAALEAWCAILIDNDLTRSQYFTAWAEQESADLTGHIAGLRALQTFYLSQPEQALTHVGTALNQLSGRNEQVQAILLLLQGYGELQQGQFQQAGTSLQQAEKSGLISDNYHALAFAQCLQSRLLRMQGKLRQAQRTIHSARQVQARGTTSGSKTLEAYIQIEQSRLYFERYQLQQALDALQQTPDLIEQLRETESRITAIALRSCLQFKLGQREQAQQSLNMAAALAEATGYDDNFHEVRGQQALMALLSGDIPACYSFLPSLNTQTQTVDIRHYIPTLIHSVLLLQQQRYEECQQLIQPWFEMTQAQALWGLHSEFALFKAQTLQQEHPQLALPLIEKTIERARPERQLLPFANHYCWLQIIQTNLTQESQSFLNTINPPANPTSPLSKREQQILTLVAQGQSNHQLTETLYISLSTVKTHLHHILKKLSVDNRTAAVDAARKQGWL